MRRREGRREDEEEGGRERGRKRRRGDQMNLEEEGSRVHIR